MQLDVAAAQPLLEAARKTSLERLAITSSSSVCGDAEKLAKCGQGDARGLRTRRRARHTTLAAARGGPSIAFWINSVLEALDLLLGRSIGRIYREPHRGDPPETAADISRAQRELGFEPTYNFRAGLASRLKWQQSLAETASH
jgi:nucleoside-diphosphate-sugar epimerase